MTVMTVMRVYGVGVGVGVDVGVGVGVGVGVALMGCVMSMCEVGVCIVDYNLWFRQVL
jgi:hypothetical protein